MDVPRFFYQDGCALAPSAVFGDNFMKTPVAGVTEAVNFYATQMEMTSNAIVLVPSSSLGACDSPVPRMDDGKPIVDIPAVKFHAFLKLLSDREGSQCSAMLCVCANCVQQWSM